jgi:hypothetical protein
MQALKSIGVDAQRITKQEFEAVRNMLEPKLGEVGIGASFKLGWTMGSAGSWSKEHPYYDTNTVKQDAGDIDIMVDASDLMASFPPKPKTYRNEPAPAKKFADDLKSSKDQLSEWLKAHGFPNTGANLNMHVKVGNKDVQVDLIVKKDAMNVIPGHQMDYSKDVGMKGSDLWVNVWPTLVKMTPSPISGKVSLGKDPKTGENISALQLSPDHGVVDRETGKVLIPWSQKEKVAQLMVGPGATGRDISSLSGIKAALMRIAPEKYNVVKEFLPSDAVKEGSSLWFRQIIDVIT